MDNKLTYKDAGVDIDEGNRAANLIQNAMKSTNRMEVLQSLGSFSGLFALNTDRYKNPVLVSGTDGVGTKLKVAFMLDKHDTIGIDAVAMCVNDVLAHGAEPLFFLDYLAANTINAEKVSTIVGGVAAGCREAGCTLIGGETAAMNGFYNDNEYDLAGFAVGVVDRLKMITGTRITQGDVILGIPSSGLHSNGYSLARKIIFDLKHFEPNQHINELGKTIGEELLTPTRIYAKLLVPLFHKVSINAVAHITGGGFYDNISRVLPEGFHADINADAWEPPMIFHSLKVWGDLSGEEMYRTFNMGIGMVIIATPIEAAKIRVHFAAENEVCYDIGRVVKGDKGVSIRGGLIGK